MEEENPVRAWFDVDQTWYRSPLKRTAIHQVLNAPRLIVVDQSPDIEAAALVLAKVLDMSMTIGGEKPRASHRTKLKAAQTYLAAMQRLAPLWHTLEGPPAPPAEWASKMFDWVREQHTTPAPRGAPIDTFDHFMLPRLLAFYRLVFSREPSSTSGGPTARFLTALYIQMSEVLTQSTFDPPEGGIRVRQAWRLPEEGTLLRKIRDFKAVSKKKEDEIGYMLQSYLENLTRDDAKTKH
ncbi:hypothetical protein [Muricoccus pecuniae]|uniref:Uncharacterized protein n=1 Tax=Muricoccus pecuniae TaxID=693023 RepID=A0A840Y5T8_9PROT|nr:hypothetical protein [Roseomonas pecuniae]MBB5695516.1 hypothetical protein [Roseomonas pecuniae]